MYLQTLIILMTVVLRLNDIRTRFLLLGFVIMLDKSIRKNKTCCRRKILTVLFSYASPRRVRKCESIIVHRVLLHLVAIWKDIFQIFMSILPWHYLPLATPALPARIPATTLSQN